MPTDSIACPTIDIDFTDWTFNQDPHPVIDTWRELGPVVYNERHDRYLTFSYRTCAKVLGNVERFDSSGMVEFFKGHFGGLTMEAIDTPRHHQMRGVWSPAFQREALEAQRQLVSEVVASRIDPFIARLRDGEVLDAIPNLTRGIPTLVIARMLGIEEEMYEQFSAWSDAMGSSSEAKLDDTERGAEIMRASLEGTKALNDYITETVARRRANGRGDDLVSMMVFDEFAKSMEESEIVASNTQLVFAGNETTAKLMASTLVALAQHPDQRRALAADPSLIPQAFEEVHRWATLVQNLSRFASSDESEVAGVHIPRGAEIMAMIGAGNRDPQRWDDPHKFDIFRPAKQHLGFGFGMHVCLGLNLARLEAQVWMEQLLQKMPDFEIDGPIDYGRNFLLRGPVAVPLALR